MYIFLLIAVTSAMVALDAQELKYDPKKVGSLAGMGPKAWGVCCFFFWLISFPAYLAVRSKLAAAGKGTPDPVSGGSKFIRFLGGFVFSAAAASLAIHYSDDRTSGDRVADRAAAEAEAANEPTEGVPEQPETAAAKPASTVAMAPMAAAAATPMATLTPFANEDTMNPVKAMHARKLLVAPDASEPALRAALTKAYADHRAEVMKSGAPYKHVYIWAFPSRKRAEAGRGEWLGMASGRGLDGAPLPSAPELSTRVPPAEWVRPTAEEESAYDRWFELADGHHRSRDYQGKTMAAKGSLSRSDLQKISALDEVDEKRDQRDGGQGVPPDAQAA